MTNTTTKREKLLKQKQQLAIAQKRRDNGQSLNGRQFALLAGVSYHIARYWFRLPGFPNITGFVFWEDFVEWRHAHCGLSAFKEKARQTPVPSAPKIEPRNFEDDVKEFGLRGAQILASAGPTPEFTGKAAQLLRDMG